MLGGGHLFDPSLQLDGKEHVGRFCDRVALKRARRARPAEREAVLEREEKGAARDRAVALRRNADDAEAATYDRDRCRVSPTWDVAPRLRGKLSLGSVHAQLLVN